MKLDDPGDECYNELTDKGYIVSDTLTDARSDEGNGAGWIYEGLLPSAEEIYERFSNE